MGTTLYSTLIRSIMEYSTVAIANINESQLQKMHAIQHKSLRLITQTLASSSREVLNLITNVIPIDLHFKLRISESLARIMSRNSPINISYDAWKTGYMRNKYSKIITTYRKLELASQQILKKNINQHNIPKLQLYDNRFPPFIETTDIVPSEITKELQKTKVTSMIRENLKYDFIIGTDGSTLKYSANSSLGPSAAAAIVFAKDNMREPLDVLTTNLGSVSHNYEAELVGIQLALQHLQNRGVTDSKILIVSDCVPAMEATFTNAIHVDYNYTIMRNKDILLSLKNSNNLIEAVWAPGHLGIQINEMADHVAKEEAAKINRVSRPLERKIVLTQLKQEVLENWQRRVNLELGNHQIIEINESVKSWKIFNTRESKHITRLITGHHFLNSFQSKINPAKISQRCSCGQPETLHHFFFTCQKYNRHRQKWLHRVAGITENLDDLNILNMKTTFGQREDLSEEKNRQLQESVSSFISETGRFSMT